MKYSSCPFGKSLWVPSGLSFTLHTFHKLLRNSEPASKWCYERWFKSSITECRGHLREERQMLFVFEAALGWNGPAHTGDELWPFCFGFALSPAALEVVVKSLQLCLEPLLPFQASFINFHLLLHCFHFVLHQLELVEGQVADSAVFAHCLLPGHLQREKIHIVCRKLKTPSVSLRNNDKSEQFKPFAALEHLMMLLMLLL